MKIERTFSKFLPQGYLSCGWLLALALGACVEEGAGLTVPDAAGSSGTKATAGSAHGGSGGSATMTDDGGSTAMNDAGAGQVHESGGEMPTGGSSTAGATAAGGSSAMPEGGVPAAGGAGGEPNEEGVHIGPTCVFHSDPALPMGEGGAGPAPTVTLQLSPFIGGYLADGAGRTLYMYGADLPGDCNTPPQSNCVADCLTSWPVFDAGERVLPAELADAGFGTIARPEGGFQTTYMGWPLYYYKADLTLGQMTGQGKGKVWHAAESTPPSVVIMKAGAVKYLADTSGHTLYVSADDAKGTTDADPVSNCSGSCLQTFEPFHDHKLSLVSSLEPLDFGVFVRHGSGGLQLAYKGQPLYRAATDKKSGDMTGTVLTGFTAAAP
jgi:predicted lipoprotein with Yx(FWY)xxD motif